ncbi:MAG TPA: hypothetical protein VLI06_02420, partial [Solimonas sp.]|nr:hypothetical protein [Solimonas sp.]
MVFKLKSASLAAFAAAAMLAPLTSGAAPKATLYGAGATLPAIAYSGSSWLGGNPPACFDTITGNEPVGGCSNPAPSPALRLTAAADAGSHFGEWTASTPSTLMPAVYPAFFAGSTTRPVLSYCQTGSG